MHVHDCLMSMHTFRNLHETAIISFLIEGSIALGVEEVLSSSQVQTGSHHWGFINHHSCISCMRKTTPAPQHPLAISSSVFRLALLPMTTLGRRCYCPLGDMVDLVSYRTANITAVVMYSMHMHHRWFALITMSCSLSYLHSYTSTSSS